MLQYALRRILIFIPLLLLIALITYGLAFYGPGDPLRILMGQNWADEAVYKNLRHQYGLDRPFIVQFVDYLGKALHGNFGQSYVAQTSVRRMIAQSAPISAQLALAALIIITCAGVGLGIVAALHPHSWLDHTIVVFSVMAHSVPVFVLAPMVLVFLVLKLQIINTPTGWHGFFSYQTFIAALVLAAGPLLGVLRLTRNSVLNALGEDYVRTARAKGLPERLVLWRHVLRNAFAPVLTSLGLTLGFLLGGSIFVESAFAIPGIGQLLFTALRTGDYPVLVATTIVSAAWIMMINLLVDITYGWLDPRIRYQK